MNCIPLVKLFAECCVRAASVLKTPASLLLPKGLNKTEKIAYNRVTYEGSTFWIVHIVWDAESSQWRKKEKIILSLLLSSECEIVKCISRSSMYHTHLLKHQKSVNSHTQRDLRGEFTYVPSPGYLVNKYPFHYVNRGNMRSQQKRTRCCLMHSRIFSVGQKSVWRVELRKVNKKIYS